MSIVAEVYNFVVGVDTHARTHSFAVVSSAGRLVDQAQFPTSAAGLVRAVDWIGRRTQGNISHTLIAVEGTSSYGARLTARLASTGYRVVEAPTPVRAGQGKTDQLDALRAARSTLSSSVDRLRDHRRHDDSRDAIAALVSVREHYNQTRTATLNMLTALLRTNDLGIDARKPLTNAQITQIAGWRARKESPTLAQIRTIVITHARDILTLDARLKDNHKTLAELTTTHSPQLLTIPAVGPVTAAIIICAWSHPGRIRNDAAFARLAGVAPIPASSGNTHRHRLDRGGDRQLNRALHQMVNTRLAHDPTTRAYFTRRLAEGKTKHEIRRCLKRYIARHIYRTLNNPT